MELVHLVISSIIILIGLAFIIFNRKLADWGMPLRRFFLKIYTERNIFIFYLIGSLGWIILVFVMSFVLGGLRIEIIAGLIIIGLLFEFINYSTTKPYIRWHKSLDENKVIKIARGLYIIFGLLFTAMGIYNLFI
jgi:hypothetical protein